MKKLLFILAILCVSFSAYSQKKKAKKQQQKEPTTLAELMEVEKVLDYAMNEAGVLYISFKSNGKNRDGLALYFCSECRRIGVSNVNKVRIMQYNTFNHPSRYNAYGILMGEYSCY
jgi:hypothetical protein